MTSKIFLKTSSLKVLNLLTSAFLCLTIFVVFVPLNPNWPDVDIENSWAFALNQANSQHLVFGKDIIFTFGPYSPVFTRSYHPSTDTLMLFGSIFFMTCFSGLLILLGQRTGIWWQLLLIFVLASGFVLIDAIFFLYLLLLVLYTLNVVRNDAAEFRQSFRSRIVYLLFFSPLGLLLLIKGNFLIITAIILAMCMIVLWFQRLRSLSFGILLIVLVSTIIFWALSGQPLPGIPVYVSNSISMVSGYSEAMAWPGSLYEVAAYCIASAWILLFFFRMKNMKRGTKYFLFGSASFLFFLVFKSSFVRHDHYHALIASSYLLLLVLTLPTVLQKPGLYITFLPALLAWGFIHGNHVGFKSIGHIPAVYKHFAKGFLLRAKGELSKHYDNKLTLIKKEHPIPLMAGTTDIYSYGHTILFASGNRWQPRPVIHSYGSYNSTLADKNVDHIKGIKAPDNIVFKMETIDGRLSPLDDGPSWPFIINNYFVQSASDSFLFLKKKLLGGRVPGQVVVSCENHQFDEDVILPAGAGIFYFQINLEQSILGKMVSTIYKPQALEIAVQVADGTEHKYRCIASMARAGFIFSPLIETNKEFSLLFGNLDSLRNKIVKSYRIYVKDREGTRNLWNKEYNVCISKIVLNN